jgi:hypothetical protein
LGGVTLEYTSKLNLYKWNKKDKKEDTIIEMANNAEKIDSAIFTLNKRAIYVNEAPFNAKGDGTDETTKLQAAVNSLPSSGGILVFPAGYTFKHRAQLDFTGKQRVTVFGHGAILESFADTPVVTGYGNLWFKDITNIAIFGLTIKANGRSRLSVSTPAPSIENSAITVFNCNHVWVRDVSIYGAVNDGIFSGGNPSDPYSDNVVIENIYIDWARRNGVSFNRNTNFRVKGGTIKNIGFYNGGLDPLAVPPMAAVDSENTSSTGVNRNGHIEGVTFINNYIDVEFYGGHEQCSINNIDITTTDVATFANFGVVLQGMRSINPNYIPKGVTISGVKGSKRTMSGCIYIDQTDDTVISQNPIKALSGGSIVESADNNRTKVEGNNCKIGFMSIEGKGSIVKNNTLDDFNVVGGYGIFTTATVKEASNNTVVSVNAGAMGYQVADATKTMFVNNMFMGLGKPVFNYEWREKEEIVIGNSTFIKRLIS